MMRRSLLRGLWIALAAWLTLSPVPAAAQKLVGSYPADKFAVARGGVDLRTGRYAYSQTDLSVGPTDGGFTFSRSMSNYAGNHANPFGNFSHNWDIFLLERTLTTEERGQTSDAYQMTVHYGGRALTFVGPGTGTGFGFKSEGLAYLTLTSGGSKGSSSAVFTAQTTDGSTMVFRQMGNFDCANHAWYGANRRCAAVSEITEADGTKYTFTYAYNSSLPGNRARLTKVVSSRGFALLLEGSGSIVTKTCVLNLSAMTVPVNGLCPVGVPTTSYTYTQNSTKLASVADADGGLHQFTYTPAGALTDMGFIKPGQSTAWLTNRIELYPDEEWTNQEIIKLQTFADGQTYTYGYGMTPTTADKPHPTIIGGAYTNAAGMTVSYAHGFPVHPDSLWPTVCSPPPCSDEPPDSFQQWIYQVTSGPIAITDELGRTWTADYCDPIAPNTGTACSLITSYTATDTDGATSRVIKDGYGNITKITKNPKPGSTGLDPIVTQAAYAVSNIKTQNKPLWIKDGKGYQADYSYDPTHGGVLSEMKPAPSAGAARPLKLTTWSQKYAYIKNTSGTLVQAATPVWVIATETDCQTVAGSSSPLCDGAAPQRTTTYQYGTNGTANNLWLRGIAVAADGITRRTCFGYDGLGRRISTTTPNANLASCP